jgi:hypothetical protein
MYHRVGGSRGKCRKGGIGRMMRIAPDLGLGVVGMDLRICRYCMPS